MGDSFWKTIVFLSLLLNLITFNPTRGLGFSFLWSGPVIFSVSAGVIYSPVIKTDFHTLLLYRPVLLVKTKLGPYLPYQSEKDWVRFSTSPVKFLDSFRFYLTRNYSFSLPEGNFLLVYSRSNVDVLSGIPDFDSAFVKSSLVFPNLKDQAGHSLTIDLSGQVDLDLATRVGVELRRVFYNRYGIGFKRCQGVVLLPQGKFQISKGQIQVISGQWMNFLCTDKGCKIAGSVDGSDLIKLDEVNFHLNGFEVYRLKGRAVIEVADMLSVDGMVELKGKDWIVKDLSGVWRGGGVEIKVEGGSVNLTTGDGWLDVRADVEVKDVGRFRFKGKVGIKGYRVKGILGPVRRRDVEVSLSWKGKRINLTFVFWAQFGGIPVELRQVVEVGGKGLVPIKKELRFLSPAVSVYDRDLWVGEEKIVNWHEEVDSLSDWKIVSEKGEWSLGDLGRLSFDKLTLFPHEKEIHAFFKGSWRPFSGVSLPIEGDAVLSLFGLSSLRLFGPNLRLHVSFENGRPEVIAGWVKLKRSVLERIFFDRRFQGDEDVRLQVVLMENGVQFVSSDETWKIRISRRKVIAYCLDWVRETESRDVVIFGKKEKVEFSREYFLLRRSLGKKREIKEFGLSWLRGPDWEVISDLGQTFRLDLGFWQVDIVKFDWIKESGMVLARPKTNGIYVLWPFFGDRLSRIRKAEVYRQDPSGKWRKIAVIRPDWDWLKRYRDFSRSLNNWERLTLYIRLLQDDGMAYRLGMGYLDTTVDPHRMYRYKVRVYTDAEEEEFESPSFLSCGRRNNRYVGCYKADFNGWALVGWKSDIEGCLPVRSGEKILVWAGSSDMCMVACKERSEEVKFLDGRLGRYLQKDWCPRLLLRLRTAKKEWENPLSEKFKFSQNIRAHVSFSWEGAVLTGRWKAEFADGLLLFKKVGKSRWSPVGRFGADGYVVFKTEGEKGRGLCYRLVWIHGLRWMKEEVIRVRKR